MSLPAINIKLAADLTDFLKSMELAQRTFKKVGDNMMEMGKTMSTYVTAPLVGLAAVSLKAAGDMEALKNGLASVTKAGESVNKEMTKLREVAKLPGLGLKEVVQGSINLQAIGVSADEARKAMLAMGNAIASVGGGKDNFDLAIRGFSQLRNAAKPLQQDLYQIANQLPQVNSLLIEAFGTSRAEDLAKMGITGKQLADFLVEGLGKLPKVTGGINNAFENLKDTGFAALATLGDAINKNFGISELLDKIAAAIGRMVSSFEKLSPGIQKIVLGFGLLLAAVGPLLTALGFLVSNILPLLKTGLTVISAIFSPMGLTIMAVVAAVAALGYAARLIYQAWDPIKNFFSNMWNHVLLSFANFHLKLVGGIKALAGMLGIELNTAGNGFEQLAKSAQKALDETPATSFGDVMSSMAKTVKGDLQGLMDWFNNTGTEAEKMGQKVSNSLGKAGFKFRKLTSEGSLAPADAQVKVSDPNVKGDTMNNPDDMEMAATGFEQLAARIQAAMQSATNAIAQAKTQIVIDFAEMLGAAITTGSGFDEFPKMIFSTFANLLTQLGKIAISAGIAIEKIKESFLTFGGAGAIAAGIGLIALGAIVRSSVKNMGSGSTSVPKYAQGGLAYGPTIGMIGDNPNAHIDPEVVAPLSKLKGMIGAGNGQAVQVVGNFRVQGQDLLLAIKNAEMRERGNS